METPELDKMHAVHGKSQAIGEFLEWLTFEKGWTLAEWKKTEYADDFHNELWPTSYSIEKLLAEYFEIDLEKTEIERRALLEEIRKSNKLCEH